MTANFRQFVCAICHDPIQYGQYLPFAHTNGRPRNARAHYARPVTRSGHDDPPRRALSGSPAAALPPASDRA